MVRKGVLIGTAAALVLGVAFVAAALVSRPQEAAPVVASPNSKVRITLVAPKEPPAPAAGSKLETVPAGAPNAPAEAAAPRPAPPPAPLARLEPRRLEPEPADDDFVDERERASADRYRAEPYRERAERWRERRFEEEPYRERRYDGGRRDDDRFEPFDPEPPPWWRR